MIAANKVFGSQDARWQNVQGRISKDRSCSSSLHSVFFAAAEALAAAGCDNSTVASGTTAAPPPLSPPAERSARLLPSPADILSVLTVEHQVDITAQRDGCRNVPRTETKASR